MLFLNFIRINIIVIVILLFFPIFIFAQNNLSGIVVDEETNSPIPGAVVQIENSFQVTSTDQNGHFSFSGLNEKNYNVTIKHISFGEIQSSMDAGMEKTIKLSKRAYLTEEVNISALRAGKNSAVAYSEIDKSQIEKYNLGKDIPQLLNFTPSVQITSDAGNVVGYSGIRIRGSDATRVNVTINGVPVNDAESHQVYWVDLPDIASSIENIQIQRGIGSSTNGAGSFGGSINIQTNKLSAKPFASVHSSVGTFNTFKNTIEFGSGLIAKNFAIEGRVSKITSDGYIDRASSDLKSFYTTAGYYGKKNSLRAVIFSGKEKTYQAWYGVPQDSLKTNRTYNPAGEYSDAQGNVQYYNNQTDNYRQDYYQLLYSHEFNNSLNANIVFHYTKGKGYYEEYVSGAGLSEYGLSTMLPQDSAVTSTDLVRQLWLSNDFYGATWSLIYDRKKLNMIVGGAINKFAGSHFGEVVSSQIPMKQTFPFEYYSDDATKIDASVYVRTNYNLTEKLKTTVDLQYRTIRQSFLGFNDDYLNSFQNVKLHFFNPKVGLNYLLSEKIQLYAMAGVGHKEPVRDDFVNSTPSKRPDSEEMFDYEFGTRYNSRKFTFNLNAYYMYYNSQLVLNGKINSVGEYIRESVKNSYRAGIELEAGYQFSSRFILNANLTLSKNRIKEYHEFVLNYDDYSQVENIYENTPIAFSPEVMGGSVLTIIPFKNFAVDLTTKYSGKQFIDNTGSDLRKIDSYIVSDIHLSYSIHFQKIKEISFHFSIYNIHDNEYVSNGNAYSGYSGGVRTDYNYFFPQAGMHFMGGVVLKI